MILPETLLYDLRYSVRMLHRNAASISVTVAMRVDPMVALRYE